MTVREAILQIQSVGTIRAERGKLQLRFPEPERARLESAIEALRGEKDAALATLSASQGKSRANKSAIELWHDGMGRLWIVADEEDAAAIMTRKGVGRGAIWTGPEIECIARVVDPTLRGAIAHFKKTLNGRATEFRKDDEHESKKCRGAKNETNDTTHDWEPR